MKFSIQSWVLSLRVPVFDFSQNRCKWSNKLLVIFPLERAVVPVIWVVSTLIRICQRPLAHFQWRTKGTHFKATSDRFLATFSHRLCPPHRRRLIGAVIGFYGENPPSWNWIEFVFCATVLALFGDYLNAFFSLSLCMQFKMASADFCRFSRRSRR